MDFKPTLVLVLCSSAFVASAVELRVPKELIANETVAVFDINIDALKRPEFLKSITEIMGETPSMEMQSHYDDFMRQFDEAGGATISGVMNLNKDMEYPTDGIVLVIGPKPGADIAKLSNYMFSFAPEMKQIMASDCPREIGGSLVWYQRQYKLPKPNADRHQAFVKAYTQLPKNQSFSAVILADKVASELVRSNLNPEQADRVDSLMIGNGICLFSNIGVVEQPALKLLVSTPDAAGAEKLSQVAIALIADLKEVLSPPFPKALESLKVVEAGTNVQVSITLPAVSKVTKDMMGAVAASVDAPPVK